MWQLSSPSHRQVGVSGGVAPVETHCVGSMGLSVRPVRNLYFPPSRPLSPSLGDKGSLLLGPSSDTARSRPTASHRRLAQAQTATSTSPSPLRTRAPSESRLFPLDDIAVKTRLPCAGQVRWTRASALCAGMCSPAGLDGVDPGLRYGSQ